MNSIVSFGKKLTADQYVRESLIASRGGRSICSKKDLEKILKDGGGIIAWNDTKTTLYDKIIEKKICSGQELAKRFHIGVPVRIYVQQFKITPRVVRELEKAGKIHAVGIIDGFSCGKRYKEPLYDVYEFEAMSSDVIHMFNEEHKFTEC